MLGEWFATAVIGVGWGGGGVLVEKHCSSSEQEICGNFSESPSLKGEVQGC
jgi:hypothetical protein